MLNISFLLSGQSLLQYAIDIGQTNDIIQRISVAQDTARDPTTDQDTLNQFLPIQYAMISDRDYLVDVLIPYCNSSTELQVALDLAVFTGNLTIVKKLISAGASVNFLANTRYAALSAAMIKPNKPMVEYLLSIGAKPDIMPFATCVGEACKLCHIMMGWPYKCRKVKLPYIPDIHDTYKYLITLILQNSRDINSANSEDGKTALWILCTQSIVCLSLHLVQAGADIHIPSNDGVTPLQTVMRKSLTCTTDMTRRRFIHIATLLICIVTHWSREQWVPLFLKEHDLILEEQPDCVIELVLMLENKFTNPSLLQHLCRTRIVYLLGINSNVKVHELHLPSRLQRFLCFEDIEYVYEEVDFLHNMTKECVHQKKWCLCTMTANK